MILLESMTTNILWPIRRSHTEMFMLYNQKKMLHMYIHIYRITMDVCVCMYSTYIVYIGCVCIYIYI